MVALFLIVGLVYLSTYRNDAGFSKPENFALDNEFINDYTAGVVPRKHILIETDTILSNDFRVKIKYNSVNKNILKMNTPVWKNIIRGIYLRIGSFSKRPDNF